MSFSQTSDQGPGQVLATRKSAKEEVNSCHTRPSKRRYSGRTTTDVLTTRTAPPPCPDGPSSRRRFSLPRQSRSFPGYSRLRRGMGGTCRTGRNRSLSGPPHRSLLDQQEETSRGLVPLVLRPHVSAIVSGPPRRAEPTARSDVAGDGLGSVTNASRDHPSVSVFPVEPEASSAMVRQSPPSVRRDTHVNILRHNQAKVRRLFVYGL